MKISDIFKTLSDEDQHTLLECLDSKQSHVVYLPGDKFIAIHIKRQADLIIEDSKGAWSIGRVVK